MSVAVEPAPSPTAALPAGAGGALAGATAPLEWTFNPWRERPAAAWLAVAIVFAGLALLRGLGLPWLTVIALGAAFGFSLGPVIVPARCRIDEDGIARRTLFGWERRRWDEIRRATETRGGLLASPFTTPRPLDRFRALLLPVPRADRRTIAAAIAPRLERRGLRPPS